MEVWTIPAERMNAGAEHVVPLSSAAVNLLRKMLPAQLAGGGGFVFPAGKQGKVLSSMAMAMLLRRMNRADLTVHGFRSTFRQWAAEATEYPREVVEAALAHMLRDKVEAAYQRGNPLERRRSMMADWAVFCASPPSLPSSTLYQHGIEEGTQPADR